MENQKETGNESLVALQKTTSAKTLISLFEKQVQKFPDNIAARFHDQQLSYQQLDQQSNQLAHVLMTEGIRPGMLVPVWLDRSLEWLVSVLAVVKTGAAYVPIDVSYPAKRAAFIISDTGSPIAITGESYESLMEDSVNQPADLAPDHRPDPKDTAYVIYTSGSTGSPKGVMVTHQSIAHLVSWHNQHFTVNERSMLTLVAGLAFDISVWETWSSLTAGATLCIADGEQRMDVQGLYAFFQRNGITHGFVPTVLVPSFAAFSRTLGDLPLKYLFTGGEQLKPVLTDGLSYDLIDYYGPTECTVFATYRKVKDENGQFVSSIGNPIPNTTAYILSPTGEKVSDGAVGELCIGGAAVAKGYYNNEEQTAQKFIASPFESGERLYLTGDRARWLPDGTIQFLGRLDHQVKIRGFRVELGEIEQALLRVAGIKDAIVLTKENSGNNNYLVAFLVPRETGRPIDITTVRQQLSLELPGYMMPAQFIPIERIPLTANGKTNRSLLADMADQQLADALASEPPVNAMEEVIAGTWSEVLERPAINRTDNFFDIGGDSLYVAAVATRLTDLVDVRVYLRDLYQYPVLKDLATALKTRREQAQIMTPAEDVEPYVELKNDVELAPDIVFAGGFDPERQKNPSAVFLTGATGFVGIHLLQEFLETTAAAVYCLVRAKDELQAMEKIDRCFSEFHIPFDKSWKQRIVPVVGDLTKPGLDLPKEKFDWLSNEMDIVYHSASHVNFIEPYSYMKAANVEGLKEIIRFCGAGRTKCLALLSTISVYSWGHVFTNKTVMLETDDIAQNLLAVSKDIGYVRSKWVMEAIADLAAEKGLPVITYRLGYAMCHSTTGASAPYQWWAGLVKNCIQLQSYPGLTELREGLITVDYMTKAIAHISRNTDATGRKFNLIARPETNLTLDDFFQLLQKYYPFVLKRMPYKEWRKQWEDDSRNRLFPLTSLFKDNMHEGLSTVELYQHTYIWDCSNVTRFLEGSGIKEPVFDKTMLDSYLAYLQIPTV